MDFGVKKCNNVRMEKKFYITKEKKKSLKKELDDLKGPKRKEILSALKYAKSLGDLSENAEYHQAREDQGKLEEKIKHIEGILKNSEVIKKGGNKEVGLGSCVVVKKEDTKEKKEYTIVGCEESDMKEGKISNDSPIGKALLGKKKGEIATFNTPGGEVNYKIIKIS
jgi:transcription elongation factor GreA